MVIVTKYELFKKAFEINIEVLVILKSVIKVSESNERIIVCI